MPPPLSLDDQELETIRTAATPFFPRQRAKFLSDVMAALQGQETVGPGTVARIAKAIQARYMSGDSGKREKAEKRFKRRTD
jgi:hypothetical protein